MAVYQARFFHDWSGGWLWAASEETRRTFGYDIDVAASMSGRYEPDTLPLLGHVEGLREPPRLGSP